MKIHWSTLLRDASCLRFPYSNALSLSFPHSQWLHYTFISPLISSLILNHIHFPRFLHYNCWLFWDFFFMVDWCFLCHFHRPRTPHRNFTTKSLSLIFVLLFSWIRYEFIHSSNACLQLNFLHNSLFVCIPFHLPGVFISVCNL